MENKNRGYKHNSVTQIWKKPHKHNENNKRKTTNTTTTIKESKMKKIERMMLREIRGQRQYIDQLEQQIDELLSVIETYEVIWEMQNEFNKQVANITYNTDRDREQNIPKSTRDKRKSKTRVDKI